MFLLLLLISAVDIGGGRVECGRNTIRHTHRCLPVWESQNGHPEPQTKLEESRRLPISWNRHAEAWTRLPEPRRASRRAPVLYVRGYGWYYGGYEAWAVRIRPALLESRVRGSQGIASTSTCTIIDIFGTPCSLIALSCARMLAMSSLCFQSRIFSSSVKWVL